MENFEKTAYIIGKLRKKYVENAYQTIFSSTRAPRGGTVDMKRLTYNMRDAGGKYLDLFCRMYAGDCLVASVLSNLCATMTRALLLLFRPRSAINNPRCIFR